MSSDLEQLGQLIKRVQHRHHRALDDQLAEFGVSLVQWNALREIERHPEASQNQLAEQTFNSAQAFGTLLTRLESRGLVERRPGAGRASLMQLTPKGKTLLRQGQKVMVEVLKQSFAMLRAAEQAELSRLLTKVLGVQDDA